MEVGRLVLDGPLMLVTTVAAYTDLRWGRVYNWLTYPAAAAALLVNALVQPPGLGLGQAALGLLVGFVPLFLAYAAGGLGGGDVKLVGAVGAFLGPLLAAYALLYSFLVGALLCVLLIVRQAGLRGLIPRLRHLGAGEEGTGRVALRLPFAVAVWFGVVWTLAEVHMGRSLLDAFRGIGG